MYGDFNFRLDLGAVLKVRHGHCVVVVFDGCVQVQVCVSRS